MTKRANLTDNLTCPAHHLGPTHPGKVREGQRRAKKLLLRVGMAAPLVRADFEEI
jgi:hypothetical protein